MTRLIFSIVAVCTLLMCEGRRINSLRGKLKSKEEITSHENNRDTIYEDLHDITIVGFEKAQNSSLESFFVVNKSIDYHIKGINFSVEYINLKGEQLHLNTLTLDCDIPPMQTRSLQMKSWDRQRLWYYVGTQGKHNDYCNPFDVRMCINYLITEPER